MGRRMVCAGRGMTIKRIRETRRLSTLADGAAALPAAEPASAYIASLDPVAFPRPIGR